MTWKKTRGMPTLTRATVTLDATDQAVGRLATKIAQLLMGKDQPSYTPHVDTGVVVKVTNVSKLSYTGKKLEQKVHFRTSNRPGGLKRTPIAKLKDEQKSGEILEHAVKYMLPKNRTQNVRMKRLIIEN